MVAVPAGWLVAVGGCLLTMVVAALFHPESFEPGVQLSTGWLPVNLLVSFIWLTVGGFVTAVIARRSEIKHAIGLILFTPAAYLCLYLLNRPESTAVQMPSWYQMAGHISVIPSVLLGAWLRMRQGVVLQRMPAGVTGTANDVWLSVAISADQFRFPIAVAVSVIICFGGTYLGMLLGGICLLGIKRLTGQDHFFAELLLICMASSLILSGVLARRVFRRIMAVNTSLMKEAPEA